MSDPSVIPRVRLKSKFRANPLNKYICTFCGTLEGNHDEHWNCPDYRTNTFPQKSITDSQIEKETRRALDILEQELEKQSLKKKQEGGDHYLKMDVQPWDVIDTWSHEQKVGFFRGNALKYIMRIGSKDEAIKEAKKAKHYLEKLIETLENDN